MEALDRVVKPKTKRAKRFLEKREPKLTENTKNAMLIKGGNASLTVAEVLKNIYALKKPFAVLYKKLVKADIKELKKKFCVLQKEYHKTL